MKFTNFRFFKGVSLFLDGVFLVILAYLLTAKMDTPLKLEWYAGLIKSPLTPPGWVFPVAWTLLYMSIGIAAGLVWQAKQEKGRFLSRESLLFFVQLGLNFSWTWIFFDAFELGLSLLVILALWVTIAMMIMVFSQTSKMAGRILVPYLIWVTFASYLTAYIWFYNA